MNKKIGVVSYNIHCNFTNYGSALQSYALCKTIEKLGYKPYLIDYCPDCLKDANPLNPYKKVWDKDIKTHTLIKKSMPYIKVNHKKFQDFYSKKFNLTKEFNSLNFNQTKNIIDSYVCGADTIFCIDEFGFDDGYYANYECMKNNAISYAPSFGDCKFDKSNINKIKKLLQNFKAISLRENKYINLIASLTNKKIYRVIDPTLLLDKNEYLKIASKHKIKEKYILLYSRRTNLKMNYFVEKLSNIKGLKIVEISLNIDNKNKGHIMKYDAGVEEFITLIKHAEYVVTNSYHGIIFSIIFNKQFYAFKREQCNSKIDELLIMFHLKRRLRQNIKNIIDYSKINLIIKKQRRNAMLYLRNSLKKL